MKDDYRIRDLERRLDIFYSRLEAIEKYFGIETKEGDKFIVIKKEKKLSL